LILLALLGPAADGARSVVSRWEFAEVHMGMPVRLVLYAERELEARTAAHAAFDRIAALDAALSDYRADSEVNHVSNQAGAWVAVSPDLLEVLSKARRIAEATGGAFDPTIGALVALWRDARREGRLPASDAIAAARARVGWRHLLIDHARGAVRLDRLGMRLDLGGIAKGFILDEARAAARRTGVTRVRIEAGGDIVAGDAPPGLRGWTVDVPGVTGVLAGRAAAFANAAVATSGPTVQFVEIDDVRYSHVVDPATGYGLTRQTVVHVMAPDGATADALATAIGVLGLDCAGPTLRRFPGAIAAETGGGRARCAAAVPVVAGGGTPLLDQLDQPHLP
jgi:thiamine biosynthesis lipoprotein